MTEFSIRTLTQINSAQLRSLIQGYTSNEKFIITKNETEPRTTITLELVKLEQPYQKQWPADEEMEAYYFSVLGQGLSLGMYAGSKLIGVAIAEKREWNRTLWVWEFHILPDFRNQGLGRKLMESLAERAQQAGCRVITCETQNTNLPAIRFYRKLGFEIGAVDLSYYTNQDLTNFELAIFMKRYLHS